LKIEKKYSVLMKVTMRKC